MAKAVTADVLSKQIKALHNQLFNAKVHFDLYMGLAKAWRGKHNREMRDSPIFWQFTMRAQINTAVSYLCRVYDTDAAALQLPRFLETVEKSASEFCESEFRRRHQANPNVESLAKYPRNISLKSLEQDREFCSESNPLVANLMRWRNNFLAHFNYREAVLERDPIHKRHPLPLEHIKILIDGGLAILNRYSALLDEITYGNQIASQQGSDYSDVLKALRLARFGRRIGMKIMHKLASGE
jgi:hypothetical protein